MAHHAHIRATPMEDDYDLSGVVKNATKFMIVKEVGKITFKPHFHIWLWTDDCKKTVRNHITSGLRIPTGTKGKANSYYCLKYDEYDDPDPSYICKDLSGSYGLVSVLGYTPAEIAEFSRIGRERFGPGSDYYQKKNRTVPASIVAIDTPDEGPKATTPAKSSWSELSLEFSDVYYDTPEEDRQMEWTMPRIVRWIKHRYLKKHLAIPQASNISRWSYSLYAIYVADVESRGYEAVKDADRAFSQ